jgi:ribosome biogenesis GTPase
MVELPEDGYIIDTPGIKGFGMVNMEKNEIYHFFPEIFKYATNCQYNNCLHLDEPKCAVKEAVKNNQISESRYLSYTHIMGDDNEKYR